MRKLFALGLFMFSVFLNLVSMYTFYRVALDIVSSDEARLGSAQPGIVSLEAPAPTSVEGKPTKPVDVKDYSDEVTSTRVLVTFTAYRLLANEGKLAGDLSLKVPVPLKKTIRPRLSEIAGCPEGKTGTEVLPRLEKGSVPTRPYWSAYRVRYQRQA
jgi:hypothetical protein